MDQGDEQDAPPKRVPPPEFRAAMWKPGQSGNPAGRPKSLARRIRELVGEDGLDLVTGFHAVWTGKASGFGGRERLEAGKWLSDRGFGPTKSADQLAQELAEEGKRPARLISSQDLESMARRLAPPRAETPATIEDDP